MNEQQLADLLSEQIDLILAGETAARPEAMADLPELLELGQRLSQLGFQPKLAAQAAFQSQLATWTETTQVRSVVTLLGTPKMIILIGLMAAALLGAGLALVALVTPDRAETRPREPQPIIEMTTTPAAPIITLPVSAPPQVTVPPTPDTPAQTSSPPAAMGDTIPAATSSISDTLSLPASVSTPDGDNGLMPAAGETDSGSDTTDKEPGGSVDKKDDHDRGHGNDPDGYDEDNPGKSPGLPTNKDAGGDNQGGGGKSSSGSSGKGGKGGKGN